MEFSLIEDAASLKAMKQDWDDLYGRSDATGFFQSFAWQWGAAAFWPVRGGVVHCAFLSGGRRDELR